MFFSAVSQKTKMKIGLNCVAVGANDLLALLECAQYISAVSAAFLIPASHSTWAALACFKPYLRALFLQSSNRTAVQELLCIDTHLAFLESCRFFGSITVSTVPLYLSFGGIVSKRANLVGRNNNNVRNKAQGL